MKVVSLSSLRIGRLYHQEIFLFFISQQSGYIIFILWANRTVWGELSSPLCGGERSCPVARPRIIYSRSDGLVRFSRLCWLSFRSGWSKELGCATSLWWCLAYLSVMTSRVNGILRSSCKVRLVTYHEASVIIRSTVDWVFCRMTWLDLLAHPHISIPYVRMGFIMVLYNNSLFSSDNGDFLPISQ